MSVQDDLLAFKRSCDLANVPTGQRRVYLPTHDRRDLVRFAFPAMDDEDVARLADRPFRMWGLEIAHPPSEGRRRRDSAS
jgi:hypothetical protein